MSVLKESGFDSDIIEWKDNVLPPTRYWYDQDTNRILTDCGVSISFVYDVGTQMAKWRYDIISAVIAHYEEQGVILTSTDD